MATKAESLEPAGRAKAPTLDESVAVSGWITMEPVVAGPETVALPQPVLVAIVPLLLDRVSVGRRHPASDRGPGRTLRHHGRSRHGHHAPRCHRLTAFVDNLPDPHSEGNVAKKQHNLCNFLHNPPSN